MSNCEWFPEPELRGEQLSDPTDNAVEWKMLAADIYDTPPMPAVAIKPNRTLYIHRNDLFCAYDGIRFANYLGVVLNVELSICWGRAGYFLDDMADKAYRMFIDRLRKFTHSKGFEPYFWTTFECGPAVGIHSHMGLYIKDEFTGPFRRWLSRALIDSSGKPMDRDDYSVRVRFRAERNITSQWRWFQYGFKGLDPRLALDEQNQYPTGTTLNSLAGVRQAYAGALSLKRVRISRTMMEAARQSAGYCAPKGMHELNPEERYSDAEYSRGTAERMQAETLKALNALEAL